MTNTTQPAPEPDMIAQAGEILRRFQDGEELTSWEGLEPADIVTGESAIVIASATLAVAGEMRTIANYLADLVGAIAALRVDKQPASWLPFPTAAPHQDDAS